MIYIKYLKSTGEILSYGTDVRPDDHPTEATIPMPEGFDLGCMTHVIEGMLSTDPEIITRRKLDQIRGQRNWLLDQVDVKNCNAERWAAMSPETQQAWSEYKQALRDFPETCDPDNPVWPTPPI